MSRKLSILAGAATMALSLAAPAANAAIFIGLQQDAGPIVTVVSNGPGLGLFAAPFGQFELTVAVGIGEPISPPSPAARLIGTPRKRTISAGEVSHGRSNEPGWSGAGRGAASARVWRSGARAWRQDVAPAQECSGAAAAARGRPGNRLARAGRHSRDADRLA